MEPVLDLSRFCYFCAFLMAPAAWVLTVIFKHRWCSGYDRAVEASSEEVLAELDREYPACRRTTIRTQT